jgi:ParB/RepB/Spo0J family partition protein
MLGTLRSARVDQLEESPDNPRTSFDARALEELAAAIREHGVLNPIIVRHAGDNGRLVIIDGARRFRAAQLAGLTEVPVTEQDGATRGLALALVANLQRADIHPLDEAKGFSALIGHWLFDRPEAVKLEAVAAVAEQLGKTKGYVWDRLKLLDLVPDAQRALHANRITLPHATVLARLLPAQQERVIDPEAGGLFTHETMLSFGEKEEDGDDNELPDGTLRDPWIGLKAVSVRELESWIAKHVRFDPHVAAAAAPFDFGPVAEWVAERAAEPGRGKKVVAITYDTYVMPEAKADERTYCASSWKRADGSDEDGPPCERAVLGVVVVGSSWGKAFPVCVHKDCDIHWKKERQERERFAKQREKGESQAAGALRRDDEDRGWKEQRAREDRERAAWDKATPALVMAAAAAIAKAKPMTLAPMLVAQSAREGHGKEAEKLLGAPKTTDALVKHQALALCLLQIHDAYWGRRELQKTVKGLDLDVAAIVAANGGDAPAASAKKTPATRTATKKTAAKKATKKR